MAFEYEFKRPDATVDVILINHRKQVLLIQRLNEPGKDMWALPGGYIDYKEQPIYAAYRELQEETGIISTNLKLYDVIQSHDPNEGWRIKCIYYCMIEKDAFDYVNNSITVGSDAKDFKWVNIMHVFSDFKLFSDHSHILGDFTLTNFVN